jgi:hypothetical protein
MSFQALSLKAPQNWAINKPRREYNGVFVMDEDREYVLLASLTMMNYRRKIKGNGFGRLG